MKLPTYIYFIRPVGQDGPIKIGCSTAPKNRLENLAAWSPMPLEIVTFVPGDMKDERFLHQCFADAHMHHEWFRPTDKLVAVMKAVAQGGSVDAVRGDLKPIRDIRRMGRGSRPVAAYREGYRSYEARIRHAVKMRGLTRTPHAIAEILRQWLGAPYYKKDGVRPSAHEFQILDQFLSEETERRAA